MLDARAPITALDLVRFAAALMVAWYHLAYWSWFFPDSTTAEVMAGAARFEPLAPWARWGWVGVEIFFVLSGFVIAFTARTKSAGAFLRSRFLRLYPAAWVCATISAVCLAAYAVYPVDDLWPRLLRSLVLFPEGPWVDGVYWTLVVEIVFYATVFATLWFASFKRLPLVLGGIGAVSAVFWLAVLVGLDLSIFWDMQHNWILSLLPFGCFFALGGMIWLASEGRLSVWQWCVAAMCLGAGAIEIYWVPVLAPETAGDPFLPVLVWATAVGVIALAALNVFRINDLLAPWAPAIRLTGLATYPLYLLHNTVGPALIRLLVSLGTDAYLALTLALSGVIAMSYLVAAAIEPAVRRGVERALFLPARKGGAAA